MNIVGRTLVTLFRIACVLIAGQAMAEERVYVFGNSLIHHLSETDETTVPHWLALMARADGQDFKLDGQWGFLRRQVEQGIKPNWSFDEVDKALGRGSATAAALTTIMINPANFIQYLPPDAPYEWENPENVTPVDATLGIFDIVMAEGGTPRFFIYEGWAELAPFGLRFPPSRRNLRRFHDYNQGEYHDWYLEYVAALTAARPELQIDLVPVASALGALLKEEPFDELGVLDLYLDDAPHGTTTKYFLAAAVVYPALFGRPLPEAFDLPDSIHPIIRENYSVIRNRFQPAEDQANLEIAPQDSAPEPPVGVGLAAPRLAMGLNGIADYSPQMPFIDIMKTARPWTGHLPGRWGGWTGEDFEAGGYLDADGWLTKIPEEVERVEALILTDLPAEASYYMGRYRVTWEGQGDLTLSGRARVTSRAPGEIWFDFRPGDGTVGLALTQIDETDPVRNIQVIREEHIDLAAVGAVFNPDWLDIVKDMRVLRFMDWMQTNHSPIEQWDERPREDDYTYVRRGVPFEVMVALSNQVGADAWVTLPHKADDAYLRAAAEHVEATLDPHLKVYVEYSNELWNFSMTQAGWANEQATALWGENAAPDAWIQFAGMRAAQVMQIWGEVFDGQSDRLVRVLATHTGWPGLEDGLLEASLWRDADPDAPKASEVFDAFAVTGYFGLEFGSDELAPEVLDWIAAGEATARKAGEAVGLKRVRLDQFIAENRFQTVIPKLAEGLRSGSFDNLVYERWGYYASVAQQYDLDLIMYEGGTHLVGLGQWTRSEDLTKLFTTFNYTPEMAGLYKELLVGWDEAGGSLFNVFVDVASPSRWGSWGMLRHMGDENPRAELLKAYNTTGTDDRGGAFLQGVLERGSDGDDQLAGTARRDIILAGAGDDHIWLFGFGDMVHGGPGQDMAVLPGARADYSFEQDGDMVLISRENARHQVLAVEFLEFTDAPGIQVAVTGLF